MNTNDKTCVDKYIDLHLHLDGAVTPDIALKLAEMQGISLPADSKALERMLSVPADCKDLNDFLACFELPLSLLQTHEALSECVYLVCEKLSAQNVIYAEIRFAPQLHKQKGMSQEDAVCAALDGLHRSSLCANLILCCMRGSENEAENMETVSVAKKYLTHHGGVTAIDLAGAEALFPTRCFRSVFDKARELGIPFTIHAGEADGADSIRDAIDIGACRIGHGVRLYEDEKLLRIVAEKGITLEMCPTSNRQTHAVADMKNYPFMDYLSRGIKVTLNTDDPAIEGTTIAEEFRLMEKDFGLTSVQERTVFANAVDAAFTTDDIKTKLRTDLGLITEGS